MQLKKVQEIMNRTMPCNTLDAAHDPMGTAIRDYFQTGHADKLRVLSSMFDEDEIPVEYLFRTKEEMPKLEKKALSLARGRILDVGAGAGCHAMALQEAGADVKAIDISPLSSEVMKQRGIHDVECINLFDEKLATGYDTILLLMNGTGIAGRLGNLPHLFDRLLSLLNNGGQVLIDSSDLRYVFETEDGTIDTASINGYYGEVDYKMKYKDIEGKVFDWLYVDYPLLCSTAKSCGLKCNLVSEGEHYDYLASLTV